MLLCLSFIPYILRQGPVASISVEFSNVSLSDLLLFPLSWRLKPTDRVVSSVPFRKALPKGIPDCLATLSAYPGQHAILLPESGHFHANRRCRLNALSGAPLSRIFHRHPSDEVSLLDSGIDAFNCLHISPLESA